MWLGDGVPNRAFELIEETPDHHSGGPRPSNNKKERSPELCSTCCPRSDNEQRTRKVIREHSREVNGPLTHSPTASFEQRKKDTDSNAAMTSNLTTAAFYSGL